MNCFHHQTVPAIGPCKSCMRGLCAACAAEVGESLACRARCEDQVAKLNRMIRAGIRNSENAATQVAGTRRVMMFLGVFIALFGAFFVWASTLGETTIWAFTLLGALILAFGVFQFYRAYRYPIVDAEND